MTTWTAGDGSGRPRGPWAVLRAWAEVIVRPRRFYRVAVEPGDQAPGLVFAMFVISVEEASRYALAPGSIPGILGNQTLSAALAVAVAVVIVTPAALHLVAAVQTLVLMAVAEDRGGVSETVQVLAYASAPCALAGLPYPLVRIVVTGYGAFLLVVGLGTVHDLDLRRAAVAAALPAALVFGYGFRGFDAAGALLARWYIV